MLHILYLIHCCKKLNLEVHFYATFCGKLRGVDYIRKMIIESKFTEVKNKQVNTVMAIESCVIYINIIKL